MKRDIVSEINDYRSRLRPSSPRWFQVDQRVKALDAFWAALAAGGGMSKYARHEGAKYLPIGYVACMESMTRLVIRDLIDRTDTGKRNIAKLKDLKFGIEHVAEIHSGTLTLGEFVSHLLPCNNLDDIERHVSLIAGDSLLMRVRSYNLANEGEHRLSLDARNISGIILDGVRRAFELRHIFCHEVAPEFQVDLEEIRTVGACSSLFIAIEGLAVTDLCGE